MAPAPPAATSTSGPGGRGHAPRPALVLLAGNPNSGKSTLFNALTGSHAKVANYPGVTVDQRSGTFALPGGQDCELVDLPGTYSLTARSAEERIAVDAVLGRAGSRPDAVVVVADATALARALYLAVELTETGVPVVLALNMVDEARQAGVEIDIARLSALTGTRVVPTVATRAEGLAALAEAIAAQLGTGTPAESAAPATRYSEALEADVATVEAALAHEGGRDAPAARRAWARWLLLSLDEEGGEAATGVSSAVREIVHRVRTQAAGDGRDLDLEVIGARYRRVDDICDAVIRRASGETRSRTDRIDAVLTHRVWGTLAFAAVMLVVFQALFTWSEPAINLIEAGVAAVQSAVQSVLPPGPFTGLLVDGVIAGVGNVVVFVPQIALLFLFIVLLEDLGYLARVAFVIDRLMKGVGLHGRAFVPMLSGFSCAVPAVMATRTMEHRADRLLTMLVLPLMSCSARLPVYVLVTATVFEPTATVGVLSVGAAVLFAMYALSVVAALGAAAVLRRTVLPGPAATFVLELPPYRRPVVRVLLQAVWQRVQTFLTDAGTIILALTIVLWALLSYPRSADVDARFETLRADVETSTLTADAREARLAAIDGQQAGEQLRYSVAGRLGRVIEPVIAPLGFDWRIGIGLLGAFTAREVFVSTLGIVFDISDADERTVPLRDALRRATWPDGRPLMTPLVGVSLMVFFVLACQCMSTIATVRRESGSWGWALFMVAYMSVLAYVAALLVYQTGQWLGWGTA